MASGAHLFVVCQCSEKWLGDRKWVLLWGSSWVARRSNMTFGYGNIFRLFHCSNKGHGLIPSQQAISKPKIWNKQISKNWIFESWKAKRGVATWCGFVLRVHNWFENLRKLCFNFFLGGVPWAYKSRYCRYLRYYF